jgi:hypothetical protein
MAPEILVTGFSSISTSGPVRGLPALAAPAEPQPITRWSTPGPRRAFLVPPFRPTDFVPDLRTRRMDRLSVWALLGSALALQDAGIEAEALDRSRTAVVCGTAYGCLDLTEEFLGALSTNASQAPPILFPETLANLPGSHIARHFGITGPNLTLSAGHVSGEAALLQAVSLLSRRCGSCLVLAGTRSAGRSTSGMAASLLAPVCWRAASAPAAGRPRSCPARGGLPARNAPLPPRVGPGARPLSAGWLSTLHESAEPPGNRGRGFCCGCWLRPLPRRSCSWPRRLRPPAWAVWSAAGEARRSLLRPCPGSGWEFGGSDLLQLGAALTRAAEARLRDGGRPADPRVRGDPDGPGERR